MAIIARHLMGIISLIAFIGILNNDQLRLLVESGFRGGPQQRIADLIQVVGLGVIYGGLALNVGLAYFKKVREKEKLWNIAILINSFLMIGLFALSGYSAFSETKNDKVFGFFFALLGMVYVVNVAILLYIRGSSSRVSAEP